MPQVTTADLLLWVCAKSLPEQYVFKPLTLGTEYYSPPILHIWTLRHREVKQPTPGHTAVRGRIHALPTCTPKLYTLVHHVTLVWA